MAREWKPGDVVTATVDDRTNVRLVAGWSKYDPQLRWCEMSPRWADGDDDDCWYFPSQVSNVRPLVAFDPDELPVAGNLAPTWLRNLAAALARDNTTITTSLEGVLHYLADRIDETRPPPKIDEPSGLGAVIEDADGQIWVRVHGDGGPAKWRRADYRDQREPFAVWSAIDAAKELSPGWSASNG